MPAPSVRAVSTGAFGTSGTITANAPTRAVGDILIYVVASSCDTGVPTHSTPDGYSSIGSGESTGTVISKISVFWKRCESASESIPSCTVAPTGTTVVHHFAGCISVQDCITTGTPYENARTNQSDLINSLAHTRIVSGSNRLSFLCTHHADNVATAVTENAADAYVSRYATDNATGIDGFTSVFTFGPRNTVNDTVTVSYTSGGTSVDISGVAFALLGMAYDNNQPETVGVTFLAEYTIAGIGNSYADGQSDSASASEIQTLRRETDLFQPTESVTASDDAGYTYQAAGVGAQYQDGQVDSATVTDAQIALQVGRAFESDSATLSDLQAAFQRHRAGVEEDDLVLTDVEISRQQSGSNESEVSTPSDDSAYNYQAASGAFLDGEIETTTITDPQAARQSGNAFATEAATASDLETSLQQELGVESEIVGASDAAVYAWAGGFGAREDGQSEQTTAGFDTPFRQEAALDFPVESVVATDDAAYAWSAGAGAFQSSEVESTSASDDAVYAWAAPNSYQGHGVESTTVSDRSISVGSDRSYESESVSLSDNAAYSWVGGFQAYSGAELESVTASLDAPFALQAELEVPDEIVSAADPQRSSLAARSSQIESSVASDNANYAWSGASGTLYLEGQVESTAATDQQASRQAERSTQAESIVASDDAVSGKLHSRSQSESVTATDVQRGSQADQNFESDAAVATDSWQRYSEEKNSQVESAACSDSWSFTLSGARVGGEESESSIASDAWAFTYAASSSEVLRRYEIESATCSDSWDFTLARAASVVEVESVGAQDAWEFALTRSRLSELESAQTLDDAAFTLARPVTANRFHVWDGSNWV